MSTYERMRERARVLEDATIERGRKIERLEAHLRDVTEALRVYADRHNWITLKEAGEPDGEAAECVWMLTVHGWKLAQAALERVEPTAPATPKEK